MSWFVLCARAWIVNALCRGLFCVPGLGLSTPYVVVCLVENNSDSDSCRKLTLLFVYVYVVIHFGECVIFLSESEYSMKESLYSDGTKQIHQYHNNEQPPLSPNIAHKTNHDIRR
jgi:hypothetical protein